MSAPLVFVAAFVVGVYWAAMVPVAAKMYATNSSIAATRKSEAQIQALAFSQDQGQLQVDAQSITVAQQKIRLAHLVFQLPAGAGNHLVTDGVFGFQSQKETNRVVDRYAPIELPTEGGGSIVLSRWATLEVQGEGRGIIFSDGSLWLDGDLTVSATGFTHISIGDGVKVIKTDAATIYNAGGRAKLQPDLSGRTISGGDATSVLPSARYLVEPGVMPDIILFKLCMVIGMVVSWRARVSTLIEAGLLGVVYVLVALTFLVVIPHAGYLGQLLICALGAALGGFLYSGYTRILPREEAVPSTRPEKTEGSAFPRSLTRIVPPSPLRYAVNEQPQQITVRYRLACIYLAATAIVCMPFVLAVVAGLI